MTPTEFQQFWTSRDKTVLKRKRKMMLLAGLVFGILTPYETDNIPNILGQFAYWVGIIFFASIISGPVGRNAFPYLQEKQFSGIILAALYSAAVALPMFATVITTDIIIGPLFIEPQSYSLANLKKYFAEVKYGPFGYILWYGQVWVVVFLIIGSISLLVDKMDKSRSAVSPAPAGQRFLSRLPANLGSDLICLAMEDHYVRVYTDLGDTLILLRMADALAELEDYPGLQTHRSWWVASSAIKRVSKENRKYSISLTNGMNAPVSQSHVEKLKQSGFI